MKPLFIVSACLAGLPCRYDGKSKPHSLISRLWQKGKVVPVCPEACSGLPVPREPCEQKNGRVISRDGKDVTSEFLKGAQTALQKALASGCRDAILKANSPSCGTGFVYDGSFSKILIPGEGIFAGLLREAGFRVYDESALEKLNLDV